MSSKRPENRLSNEKKYILAFVVLLISATAGYFYHGGFAPSRRIADQLGYHDSLQDKLCPVEYGQAECVNGKVVMPFYNPTEYSLQNFTVKVPVDGGVNIYNVREPLEPNQTNSLTLLELDCEGGWEQSKIGISWCCQDQCFSIRSKNPSDDLEVSEKDRKQVQG